jgi:dihydropteroate synthase
LKIQIKNISFPSVFKECSQKYNIFRDVYEKNLFGLEIRNISSSEGDQIHKIVLSEKEICYKCFSNNEPGISIFIPGAVWYFKELAKKILASGNEDVGYKIINAIKRYEEYDSITYDFGVKTLDFKKNYVMGILNVTPDSFSDGGRHFAPEDALNGALKMIEDGADIIDIGGESTRPGSDPVSADEELKRVIPVLQSILKIKKDLIISIDTNKSEVAEAALQCGAAIINDISGLTFDAKMPEVIAKYNAGLVIMHIKGTPKNMQQNPNYESLIDEIYDFLYSQAQAARKNNIKNIFIDPGIGFGKTVENNFEIIKRLEDFKTLGYPILIGVSRKSFLGKTFGFEVTGRDNVSAITEALALKNGAKIIRTHNVKLGKQAVTLTDRMF